MVPPPRELDEFVKLVAASGLLDDQTLQSALDRFHRVRPGRPADADLMRAFAAHLVVHGYLTAWQSEVLLTGQWNGFFLDHYKLYDYLDSDEKSARYRAEDATSGEHVVLRIRAARMPIEYRVED